MCFQRLFWKANQIVQCTFFQNSNSLEQRKQLYEGLSMSWLWPPSFSPPPPLLPLPPPYPLCQPWLLAPKIKQIYLSTSFPCGSAGKEFTCKCKRPGFNLWVGKIPWRRERLSTPVFWPGELHGLFIPWGCKESDKTEQLSPSLSTFPPTWPI